MSVTELRGGLGFEGRPRALFRPFVLRRAQDERDRAARHSGARFSLGALIVLPWLAIAACDSPAPVTPAAEAEAPDVAALIADRTREFMRLQPLLSSFVDLPENEVGGAYNHRVTDYSPAGFAEVRRTAGEAAAALDAVPREGLGETERTDLDVVAHIFRYYAGAPGIDYGLIDGYFGHVPYAVSQISGPHVDIPKLMQTQQRLASQLDAEAFLARLAAIGPAFDGVIAKIEADRALGVVPPRILVEKALKPVEAFIAPPAGDNVLVAAFAERLGKIDSLTEADRTVLTAQAKRTVETVVYPAYRKLAATLGDLLPQARDEAGVWALPDGEAFYRHAVAYMGDTDMTPDEVHEVGLAEVARISAEMDAILRAQGHEDGSIGERMVALAEDPEQLFPDSDEGRAALLDLLRAQVAKIDALVPEQFATVPPQKLEIRRIPEFSQDGEAGGFYTSPSLDGTRPGIYWINLRDMKAWPRWSLATLSYHEAVPGHHFQSAINLMQGDLPLLRRIGPFNAYAEGWGLYSERLAFEMGLYEDDPLGNLGRLQDELFRAVRLVVDTGLHARRWTREQAIDYMHGATGADMSEVVPEIERYMAWPGQALGYKLGMLKILELREQARAALDEDFDIREFHDVVLLGGAVPMAVLGDAVGRWVAKKRGEG